MNADERRLESGRREELTEKVIRCALSVSNTLGCGFLEKVYENALAHELHKAVKELDDIHLAQCLNYLKATKLRLCLLMNFGKPKLEVRRIVNNY